jgi:hypothetical protein
MTLNRAVPVPHGVRGLTNQVPAEIEAGAAARRRRMTLNRAVPVPHGVWGLTNQAPHEFEAHPAKIDIQQKHKHQGETKTPPQQHPQKNPQPSQSVHPKKPKKTRSPSFLRLHHQIKTICVWISAIRKSDFGSTSPSRMPSDSALRAFNFSFRRCFSGGYLFPLFPGVLSGGRAGQAQNSPRSVTGQHRWANLDMPPPEKCV